jgi:hypothetical protein
MYAFFVWQALNPFFRKLDYNPFSLGIFRSLDGTIFHNKMREIKIGFYREVK